MEDTIKEFVKSEVKKINRGSFKTKTKHFPIGNKYTSVSTELIKCKPTITIKSHNEIISNKNFSITKDFHYEITNSKAIEKSSINSMKIISKNDKLKLINIFIDFEDDYDYDKGYTY